MDLTLIKKVEIDGICYKLLRVIFYKGYFAIIVQNKREFCCTSFSATLSQAEELFDEISASTTEPYCIRDIISDFEKQNV